MLHPTWDQIYFTIYHALVWIAEVLVLVFLYFAVVDSADIYIAIFFLLRWWDFSTVFLYVVDTEALMYFTKVIIEMITTLVFFSYLFKNVGIAGAIWVIYCTPEALSIIQSVILSRLPLKLILFVSEVLWTIDILVDAVVDYLFWFLKIAYYATLVSTTAIILFYAGERFAIKRILHR